MKSLIRRVPKAQLLLAAASCLALALVYQQLLPPTYGAQLGQRRLQLTTNQFSAISDYNLSFSLVTAGPLGSIRIQFCSNDPLPDTACTAPAGLDVAAAALATQTGATGFSISPATTVNELILTRPVANAAALPVSYHFTGVTNPSSAGSYYVRLLTYATDDASGAASDYGGIAFAIANDVNINVTVPPYLIFCTGITITGLNCATATGNYIDFGELSRSVARSGSSQMLVATNAELGYNVTINGTTMTSGNNIIPALAGGDVSRPGTGQFGLNLRANNTPPNGNDPFGPGTGQPQPAYNQPNTYRFATGDTVISHDGPDNIRQFTASYITNVPPGQAPGVYVSTITYICLANF